MILKLFKANKFVASDVANNIRSRNIKLIVGARILTNDLFKDAFLGLIELAQSLRETTVAFCDVLLGDNGHIVGPHLANPALVPHNPTQVVWLAQP